MLNKIQQNILIRNLSLIKLTLNKKIQNNKLKLKQKLELKKSQKHFCQKKNKMKIDCLIHQENQCIFLCVAQSCTSKNRFLCSECITEQDESHNHSMVSLSSLNKMEQSAQFKLLSFADPKKQFTPSLKMQNVDERVSKIIGFYESLQQQIIALIQQRMKQEVEECTNTACTHASLLKQSKIEEVVQILFKSSVSGNQADLDKEVNDFFSEYHKSYANVEKFLKDCYSWEQKFSYVEDIDQKVKEIVFKFEQAVNKFSPNQIFKKSNITIEILNSIQNEEILLPSCIKYLPEVKSFSKVEGVQRNYIGIIDVPITKDLLKTSFKVKVHKRRWVGIGLCERDLIVSRDYQCDIKLIDKKSGLWFSFSNGDCYQSEEDCQIFGDSKVYFRDGDILVVTPYQNKIDYYVEGNPDRIYSQKFTYDENKVYCPCFVMYQNGEDQIEFIQ
ncbi:hypothetical protein TTHERM_00784460 (macronuclear) [Tetrahymena thermophila SB210]|uniref:Uncharacterized protein n=1 Tax=Tetrahymena thermophila (strain SB210) TaxID=312017 RepID=Q231P3_TETTS|nr:hypothetical protein TTHERM_00784460 [Tetrahymena thermophila SB210]EAR91259.4 hypothetical protein TTHERM_00784460 [Tetrahymena thermophila SB210]|eukprot:XP_001011504.4 hypothetical protein TTHERM_00784460 [Tetrahymena thermophila SB210]